MLSVQFNLAIVTQAQVVNSEHEISTAHKNQRTEFRALKHSETVFILLINVKMPTQAL